MTLEMHLIYAALMLQRKNLAKTKYHLDVILDQDWKNIHANVLYGFYYKLTEWHQMARKHFAIAKVKRMRDLGILPPKSIIPKNFRTEAVDFKVEIIDYQSLKTNDETLTPKDSDLLFFELIDFLLQRQIYGTADIALEYIQDRVSSRYLMAKAKIRVHQEKFTEATQALDKLLETNPNDQNAWVLRGHAFYLLNNLFDSEESYINALRIKIQGKPTLKDQMLQVRLGIIFCRRQSWKDAKTVFLKICKDSVSTTSWLYLGLSLIKLGELEAAEDAIAQANILDNNNPNSWGLSTILCLSYDNSRL